jgi:predicted small lipoprotein YifL
MLPFRIMVMRSNLGGAPARHARRRLLLLMGLLPLAACGRRGRLELPEAAAPREPDPPTGIRPPESVQGEGAEPQPPLDAP